MATYGFLGLGIMGEAMAGNLLRAGHELIVWNRTGHKCQPLVNAGARQAQSPAEVVAAAPVTIAMLADPEAAKEVALGASGVLSNIPAGHAYVDMSTVDPATSQEIGRAVVRQEGRFLEAPVSGSKVPAQQGQLVIMTAGDESLYQQIKEDVLAVVGKASFFLGEVGQAARMKLIVNMVMGGMLASFCEGLRLAQNSDLPMDDLLAIFDAGALANPMFHIKGQNLLEGRTDPHFPLKHMQKDMRLAVGLGDSCQQPLHTSAAANECFKMALQQGWGDSDMASLWYALGGLAPGADGGQ